MPKIISKSKNYTWRQFTKNLMQLLLESKDIVYTTMIDCLQLHFRVKLPDQVSPLQYERQLKKKSNFQLFPRNDIQSDALTLKPI